MLILIGLDNAGKTRTLNNLAGEKDDKVLPTVGFKAVNLVHRDTPVTIYDLGGGPEFRQIWPQYYSEVHGVIFVIDSSDFSRLEECKVVLEEVLSHHKISGELYVKLIYCHSNWICNKCEGQGCLPPALKLWIFTYSVGKQTHACEQKVGSERVLLLNYIE